MQRWSLAFVISLALGGCGGSGVDVSSTTTITETTQAAPSSTTTKAQAATTTTQATTTTLPPQVLEDWVRVAPSAGFSGVVVDVAIGGPGMTVVGEGEAGMPFVVEFDGAGWRPVDIPGLGLAEPLVQNPGVFYRAPRLRRTIAVAAADGRAAVLMMTGDLYAAEVHVLVWGPEEGWRLVDPEASGLSDVTGPGASRWRAVDISGLTATAAGWAGVGTGQWWKPYQTSDLTATAFVSEDGRTWELISLDDATLSGLRTIGMGIIADDGGWRAVGSVREENFGGRDGMVWGGVGADLISTARVGVDDDGIGFTAGEIMLDVAAGNGRLVVVGKTEAGGAAWMSTDGSEWSITLETPETLRTIDFLGGVFVVSGSGTFSSTDGSAWDRHAGSISRVEKLVLSETGVVAVADGGVFVSPEWPLP